VCGQDALLFACPSNLCCCRLTCATGSPDDHLAYFVSALVDELDLGAIERGYEVFSSNQPGRPLQRRQRTSPKILSQSPSCAA